MHSRTLLGQNNKAFTFAILAFGLTIFAADYINLRSSVSHHFGTEAILQSTSCSTSHAVEQGTLQAAAVLLSQNSQLPKPIMTTFFEPVEVEGGCCGMTQQGQGNLVSSWSTGMTKLRMDLLQSTLIDTNISEYDIGDVSGDVWQ